MKKLIFLTLLVFIGFPVMFVATVLSCLAQRLERTWLKLFDKLEVWCYK